MASGLAAPRDATGTKEQLVAVASVILAAMGALPKRPGPSPLVMAWKGLLGQWLIPYDPTARQTQLAPALEKARCPSCS
jgi:hypothetical protein